MAKINLLPVSFIQSICHVPGFQQAAFEQVHQGGEQITSIRLNPAKPVDAAVLLEGHSLQPVPWNADGYYLSARPSFTTDPMFHAGAYYVQEASSMFLGEVLRQVVDLDQPLQVLDLCAAPGGKSTLIQSMINAESVLVSNEVIKARVNILAENITKWGAANVIVTNNDPSDFKRLPDCFDAIVVDAPCSGSGLFRKDPNAMNEWSQQNVALCSQRQQRILADILPSLKEGGTLIYSTCSYSEEEDEAIADWLVESFQLHTCRLATAWGIVETRSKQHNAYGYRFYPDQLRGEGFFIAAFKKPGIANPGSSFQKTTSAKVSHAEAAILATYLQPATAMHFIRQKEEFIALPASVSEILGTVQSALYIRKAGVKMGSLIRNELIPDHELALSTKIGDGIAQLELDLPNALQYLRRQDVQIDTALRGWVLITHRSLPLGWAKLLPNRVNNYYPKEWRILNK